MLNRVEAGLSAALSDDSFSGHVVNDLDGAVPFELSSFDEAGTGGSAQRFSLGTLDDVELELQIELGRAELLIEEVLALREGAVVPLDKLAGDPVDILVNGRLLARGEVLVLNDNFCVRVAEIVSPDF
ncbi:flagellar motor switch protein FliN [bacterium]|nr:flagellar motor switch protein FliN [bacterium]